MDAAALLESGLGEQRVAAFLLVLARISPLFILAPLFSSKAFPPRARSVVAIGLALGMWPVAWGAGAPEGELPLDPFGLGGLVVKELLVGLAFAFAVGAIFHALSVAGAFLDTLIGFSFGALIDPVTGNSASILGQLYALVGVAIFIAIGGDAWVVQGLARTYEVVPLGAGAELDSLVDGAVSAFAGVFAAAIQVCAPVLLAIVITDVAIGVVSRVMPQLNVFAVGFPAKVAVGMLLIGISLPFAAGWIGEELQRSVAEALGALEVSG